jgi:hypothetical protein
MASCAVEKWSCALMNFEILKKNFSNASQVAAGHLVASGRNQSI